MEPKGISTFKKWVEEEKSSKGLNKKVEKQKGTRSAGCHRRQGKGEPREREGSTQPCCSKV